MKGQFFLAGAFALAIIFFVGISAQISPEGIVFPKTTSVTTLFDNLRDEYPRAANLGLNESKPIQTLTNFTDFVEGKTKEKGVEFSLLFILTQNVSDDLNVTVGNFMGYPINIGLNVSGNSQTLQISDGGTGSKIFTNPPKSGAEPFCSTKSVQICRNTTFLC